jgi:hypothetical protein
MYSREHYHDTFVTSYFSTRYLQSVHLLKEYCGQRHTLLDFGCGEGLFMLAAQSIGFSCTGVELDASAIQRAGEDANLPTSDLKSLLERGSRFDIIHLGDVFEHLPNPYETIGALNHLMNRNGLFFVEGPLERNPSLVYYVARTVHRIKRATRRKSWTIPPWHLTMVDAQAQEDFFTKRMRYRKVLFQIAEDGWPYCTDQPRARTLGLDARRMVGQLAIALSRTKVGRNANLGNRFQALFEVTEVHD